MQVYKTRDFYLSGFLLVCQYQLVRYQRIKGLTEFVFLETPELREAVRKYYAMDTSVDPMTYSVSIRNLKSLIHSQRDGETQLSTSAEVLNNEFVNKFGAKQQEIQHN